MHYFILQIPQQITLMELPSLASETASFSFKSFETIFFKTFFKLFDIFPSTVAVAANSHRNKTRKGSIPAGRPYNC
jgi:hypothetical protein